LTALRSVFEGTPMLISIRDEAGEIDLNAADGAFLRRLLRPYLVLNWEQ
jgi:hypothetical protein